MGSAELQGTGIHAPHQQQGKATTPTTPAGKSRPLLNFLLLRQARSSACVLGNSCYISGSKASLGFA